MNKYRRGLIFVISSPSGAGKTTICKKIINNINNIDLSVSVTTRKKRVGEIDGLDYFFKSEEEFLFLKKSNMFIESANVFGNHYGTLKSQVENKISSGIDVLIDIDWQGTRQINKNMGEDLVKVFILPPSIKELEIRLGKRGSESKEDVKIRMSQAKKEISHYNEYDFIVVNKDIDKALDQLKTILFSERLRRCRQLGLEEFIEKLL